MKIYWKGEPKFSFDPSLVTTREVEAYPNPEPYTSPCLVICHAGGDVLAEFLDLHRPEIKDRQMAVLAVSGTVIPEPGEREWEGYVHCLKYGLSTPCRDSEIIRRFEKLVKKVEKLNDWVGINLNVEVWSIIEREPWPEHLVAAYLGVCAGMPGTVPNAIWAEAWQEYKALADRFRIKGGASDVDQLKCDGVKIRELLERVHASHQG